MKILSGRMGNRPLAAAAVVLPAAVLFLGGVSTADALYPLGEGEVFLNLNSGVTYDSNIFARDTREKDWILEVGPELQYLRRAGLIGVDLRGGVNFGFFHENTDLNFENFFTSLNLVYPEPGDMRLSLATTLSARQESRTSRALGTWVRTRTYEAGSDVRYDFTGKFSGRAGLSYSHVDYSERDLRKIDRYSARLDGIWRYTPTTEFFSGYRFRYTETSRTGDEERRDSMDHALIVGVEGEIAPTVTGLLEGGYQTRVFSRDAGDRREQVHVAGQLNWDVRQDTSVRLTASRDFDTSATRQSVERSEVGLTLVQELRARLELENTLRYLHERYRRQDDRTDDVYEGEVALNYGVTETFSGRVGYAYTYSESDNPLFEYDRHRAFISSTLRF